MNARARKPDDFDEDRARVVEKYQYIEGLALDADRESAKWGRERELQIDRLRALADGTEDNTDDLGGDPVAALEAKIDDASRRRREAVRAAQACRNEVTALRCMYPGWLL